MTTTRWIQDPVTHKLIPASEYVRPKSANAHYYIQPDIDTFKSVVDGSVVSSRRQLAEHNKRNNVVCAGEYDNNYYERKAKERAVAAEGPSKKVINQAVADAFKQHGV